MEFLASLLLFLQSFTAPMFGSQGIQQLNPWRTAGTRVELASTTAGLRVPSLASLDCIGTDADGDFGSGTCGSGGGEGGLATTSPWTAGQLARVVDGDTLDSIATSSLGLPTFTDLADYLLLTGGTISGNLTVQGTTSLATTSITAFIFDSVTGTQWSDFCTAITGGAGLCDGDDATGSGGGATTTINGASGPAFTFTTGTTGTDFNIATSSGTVTFNIPDAGASARGLVTTGTQTFAGAKTFTATTSFSTSTHTSLLFTNTPTYDDVALRLNTRWMQFGPTFYPANYVTSCDNCSYFVMDKDATADDTSIVFRDQGNARAEIGLVGDNALHIKTVSGTFGSESFSDALVASSSRIGIGGITNPSTALDVLGTASATQFIVNDSSGELSIYSFSDGGDYNIRSGNGNQTLAIFGGGGNTLNLNLLDGVLTLTPLATSSGAFLAVNASGQVIATTTPSSGGIDGSGVTGQLAAWTDTDTITATSAPTVDFITAASTTATSTFPNISVTGAISLLGEYFTNFTTYVRSLFSAGTGLSYAAGQFSINQAANLAWTGQHDFGGATFLEIPNGTAPTANDPGEIAHDTTSNQLIVDDLVMAQGISKLWSTTVASTSPAFISAGLLPVPPMFQGYTITDIACKVDGGTSKVIAIEDASGNSTEDITCTTSVTQDDGSITNAQATALEEMYIDFGATSGSVNYVTITAYGTITRE